MPAFVGLGSPHWEPEARGTIVGLTRGTTAAQVVRAALEAMAFGSLELIETMLHSAGQPLAALRVDGGASANEWLMQFQADLLDAPVERPENVETTALGAAALAGLALGVWPSLASFPTITRSSRFTPHMDAAERHERIQGWKRAVDTALFWAKNSREP